MCNQCCRTCIEFHTTGTARGTAPKRQYPTTTNKGGTLETHTTRVRAGTAKGRSPSHTLAYGQYEPRPASCGSSSGQFERPATRHGGHHRLVDAGGTQRRTSIARAACGRTSASHAVRHVVQKQVDAVRKRHRACKTSAAVVAVGASCATAVAVGRTRPERVRPARGRGDNELTVGRISKRLPQ